MNVALFKYVEELARTLRFYEHILENDDLADQHKTAQLCKEVLTPVYYEIKEILQSFDTSTKGVEA